MILSSKQPMQPRPGRRGFTLVEMLVAITVFAIAVGVAFVLYNAAQSSYKEGEQFTEQQQNTRVAFDRLVEDLRMAGYNYNPDGDISRPDEQIEGAWDTAITVRGDFDFEITPADDPTDNNVTPETALTGSFNVVTTGNSEIVTFALGKPNGGGGVDLVFHADVEESARDGDVEEVRIPNIHLDQSNPPYTLYRITLNNDATEYGSWGDFAIKQPIADNIKSMTFKYFDAAGNQLNTFDLAQTADDIGGDEASADVATRESIRRIEVDLVGLTPDPDLDYVDSGDAIAATRNYRKFQLTTDVVSQNLGLVGMPDNILTAPRMPQNVSLCTGHCEGIIVGWDNQYASEDAVVDYTVWYGTDPAVLDTPIQTAANFAWVGNLTGGPYYFGVQARNGADQNSNTTAAISGAPANDTKPQAVDSASLYASSDVDPGHPPLDSLVDLGWGPVDENTSEGASEAVSGCDPVRPVNRDLAGYRVYRAEGTPVPLSAPIVTETTIGASTTWTDTTVVNCRDYNYVVTAVDSCGTESDPSAEVPGRAETVIPPAAPLNVVAQQSAPYTIDVSWDPVTENTSAPPDPIAVAGYNVYAAEGPAGTDPDSLADNMYWLAAGPVPGNMYQHFISYVPPGYAWYFKVSALDDCPNESEKSSGAEATCEFSGTLSYDPQDGDNVAGAVPMNLSITGAQTYTRGLIRVKDLTFMTDVYYQETWVTPFAFPDWDSTAVAPGTYEVIYEVENSTGCIVQESVMVTVNSSINCCVDGANPNLKPTKGMAKQQNTQLAFDIANNCALDIEIIGIETDWTENITDIGINAQMTEIQFPTGTPVYSFATAAEQPAFADFLAVPLFLSQFNDSVSPLNIELHWDDPMADKTGPDVFSETIYIRFDYKTVISGQQGYCTMQVKPEDGTVVDIDGS